MLIFAPVCGSSIMSLRSMDLKRPLRARSSLAKRATSKESAAASAAVNGTMAGRIATRTAYAHFGLAAPSVERDLNLPR